MTSEGTTLARASGAAADGRQVVTPVAWAPAGELRLADWLAHGRRLGALGRGVAWWLGDWLRYGNLRYGERYARAAQVTGYDRQSLMNMVYVASRFEPARRRPGLSWSHHAEVAALEGVERDRWLDLAEAQCMSVRSLRIELQALRRRRRREGALESGMETPPPDAGHDARVVCPNCRCVIDWHGAPDGAR